MANKFLSNVPLDKVFWVCDGRILKNINELAEAIKTMSDDTFAYHCNPEKNDFTNWIRDVVGDADLAGELSGVRKREVAFKKVKHRIDVLKGKIEETKPRKKRAKSKKTKSRKARKNKIKKKSRVKKTKKKKR